MAEHYFEDVGAKRTSIHFNSTDRRPLVYGEFSDGLNLRFTDLDALNGAIGLLVEMRTKYVEAAFARDGEDAYVQELERGDVIAIDGDAVVVDTVIVRAKNVYGLLYGLRYIDGSGDSQYREVGYGGKFSRLRDAAPLAVVR